MELHDQAAGYVLGILEAEELEQFEAHLGSCEVCRSAVQDLQGSTEVLFEAAYQSPPAGLKSRVMGTVGSSTQPVTSGLRRMPTARTWGWVGAAAVVILLVGVGLSGVLAGDPVADIVAASDATTIPISASGSGPTSEAVLELVYSPSLGQAVLTGSGLVPSGEGMVYQMWLVGEGGPVSAGIFQPDQDGEVSVLIQGLPSAGERFGITAEPAGGSDQPTGEALFSGEL